METLELLNIIEAGETSKVQFKEMLDSRDSIAAEMIAMSNSRGGIIMFGVKDKTGEIAGLDYAQLQKTGNALSSIASDSVKPQIFIETEVVNVESKNVLIVYITEGISKPYKDRLGTIWVKQGGDKRKLTDNNEIIRLFQQSGIIYADEMIIPDSSVDDLSIPLVKRYLEKLNGEGIEEEITPNILKNINIGKRGKLTLGGLMFFAKDPQKFRPSLCVKAISFYGNDIAGSDYRDSEDITGTIPEMFDKAMAFFKRNLQHRQNGQNFNSVGILEISDIALEELLQNALTHRDYTKNSPIRLMIFDNRVEIVSPGKLPNSLTVENIKMGNAVARNNLIVTFCSKIMNYRGYGSGIMRSLKNQPDIELYNDVKGDQFKVKIPRDK